MSAPNRAVLRFLASIGRPAEAELYLSLYRAERRESFAVIAVDPEVMGVAGDALAVDLEFLAELDELLAPGALSDPHRHLLERARVLVDGVPHALGVAVTSPLDLLRELFTVRGAGTLVRRGTQVASHRDLAAVDRARLAELVEAAFGRPLRADFWARPIERVYVAGDYRGAAVVSPTSEGAYLTKLAVDAPARGEGIGRDLWRALTRDYPTFYWRARADNPIASWYQEQCDGMVKRGAWRVYWRGLEPARIPAAVAAAEASPVDFD